MNNILDRAADIAGKLENAGNQHFLVFLQCFRNAYTIESLKLRKV